MARDYGRENAGWGPGLVGMMASPTNQTTCNVIFWKPQTVLPTPQPEHH